MMIVREVDTYGGASCRVKAFPTGRPDSRGELSIRISDYEGDASATFTPDQARALGSLLIELADKAERFSTHGFVGSKEPRGDEDGVLPQAAAKRRAKAVRAAAVSAQSPAPRR